MAKATTPAKPLTKTELLANIAAAAELPKTQVSAVLDALSAEIQKSLGSKGPRCNYHFRVAKDREETGRSQARSEGSAEPLQARRIHGSSCQARLQQGQGAGVKDPQGNGQVTANAPATNRGIFISTNHDQTQHCPVIAEDLGRTQMETKEIVQKTLDAIIEVLVEEGRVELRNFGVFEVKKRNPRQARNPKTGEKVMVGERMAVTFKPGRVVEERVASEYVRAIPERT